MATVYEFNYTGSEQRATLKPGKYKLECWGACGGRYKADDFTTCAKGGYAKGEIILKEKTNFRICVGQSGYEKVLSTSSLLELVIMAVVLVDILILLLTNGHLMVVVQLI